MKTFHCCCGNQLFFPNTQCIACGREAGLCPVCHRMTGLIAETPSGLVCGHEDCQARLVKCRNYEVEHVCNACIEAEQAEQATEEDGHPLCLDCQLTEVIPDLSIEGNREKWAALEIAKRRVLYTVRFAGLPIGHAGNDFEPKLRFQFLADTKEKVFTGHDSGLITINIREADDVERERTRVEMHEPQRTLIGHLRHELGHYFWDLLIAGRKEEEFRTIFGDEREPSYADAQAAYYQNGPAADWRQHYISAYSSMHPWEDFAETFNAWLDMISILDTARDMRRAHLRKRPCEEIVREYQRVGVFANELNREMGLKDLVPEVFNDEVRKKLCFVHQLAIDGITQKKSLSQPAAEATVTS